ncbi:solute carrier family 22 member 23 isoform X1 [Colossoma macropomum]|uniref:solute carrier family 22 member 23 isoform X1 n=1 Tax=Colossoma macropomum TaxID=42526 RepID=UPI0018645DD6|nr:solute carrier family 22 member 23 isoform X1 [Colossoma macropomum]
MAAACEREREPEPRAPENGFVSAEQHALLSRVDGCVLHFLGGFGTYQKRLVALTWIPALFIGFSHFSDYFLLALPKTTCVEAAGNGTLNWTLPLPPPPPCALPQDFNGTGLPANGSALEPENACTRWTSELQTGLVQNVVTKWNLVCTSEWKVHIAKFSLLVGTIFGYLVLGVLADWFGRHLVLIISVFFTLVFGMTVAFSVDVTMFSTLRFFEGFFLAGITLSLYVLRIELCLPGWRFSMTMVANFLMLAGQLLMPGLAALCRDWQVLQAVIICPLLLMLTYIWLFPESLRWLLATQQYCRAKRIVEHIAKTNRAQLDSDELLTELHKALPKKPKKTCIVKVVGTRTLWKNVVVLCVNSLTGYGIHHCFARSMMDPDGKEITMFHNFYADYYTMGGIAVASCMALCPAVGLMGRRGGLLMFMIITALASLLQLGLLNLLGKYSAQLQIEESDTLKSKFSVAFSIIGMFSSHAVSNLSIFFCAEITPTVIRGGGLGLVLASAGFGMLTAPIMELHNQKGYFLHHVIFACCTLICIICILLLPETRYQPLPETLADGESYTRQPLLPPRKPAEQRHLLPRAQSREYGQVTDTPLHVAAATAVSTMESTASSAIDLSVPPDGEPDSIALYVMKQQKELAEPAGGTLLTAVPNASTPLSTSPIHPNITDSLPDLIANVPSPHSATETPPTPLSGHTLSQTTPSAASVLTADTSEIPSPSTATETPPLTDHGPPQPIQMIPDTTETQPHPSLLGHAPSEAPAITPLISDTTGTPHLLQLTTPPHAHSLRWTVL